MLRNYQYRIYPTKAQAKVLETSLDACRTLYNQALHWRKTAYEQKKESISYGTQAVGLTQLRKQSEFWRGLHIDIEQDALRRLDKAFDAFFRRVKTGEKPGYPRFKGEGRYRSMTYSHLSVNLVEQTGNRRDLIAIPKLGKNHHLAKSISDAAWGNFLLRCASKAESAGKHFVKVPAQNTSQICSCCGVVVQKSLATRIHRCGSCSLVLDRDQNAALNILHRGIEALSEIGHNFRAASALRGGVAVVNAPERKRNAFGEARITAYGDRLNKLRPSGRRS